MDDRADDATNDPYYDGTLRAGYYNLSGVEIAQHTYAMVSRQGQTYALPCFGSFATQEGQRGHSGVQYPAEMWTPWILWSRSKGFELPANLLVALGMAQFSISPGYDWTENDWDAYWRDNPGLNGYSVGSWAGIVYGITGVCHQACNRILWSTTKGNFLDTAVNWPPSLSASYWVYGFHGRSPEAAAILAGALVIKALLGDKADEGELRKSEDLARTVMHHQTVQSLRDPTESYGRAREVRARLERLEQPLSLDAATIEAIVSLDRAFAQDKKERDAQLYQTDNDRQHDDYAGNVNQRFRDLLSQFRNLMPPQTFAHFFPDAVENRNYSLVDRRLMPPNYRRHREGLTS